jgi:hypothetical protein
VAAINIVCLLGRISSPDADVHVDTLGAQRNSTRWIFDVSHDTATSSFRLQLRDSLTDEVKDYVISSVTFTPFNVEAAGAKLRVPIIESPTLTIDLDPQQALARYRVTVDTVHSLSK